MGRWRGASSCALALTASLLLVGCTSTGSSSPPATTAGTPAATPTTAASQGSGAENLPVTADVRSQLVAAGAALNQIPVSEYSGLASGLTYYALDRATGTYWAAARLVPAPSSDPNNPTRAQIASQDDGSYTLFNRPSGATWTAYADGNVGPATPCPVTVPAAVVAAWGWTSGSCRPANT